MFGTFHRKFIFPGRIDALTTHAAKLIPAGPQKVIDIGAGDGQFAARLTALRPELSIVAADPLQRTKTFFPVTTYDGTTLPFSDRSFDSATIIDVLHHANDPAKVLSEALRVTRGVVVVKDHYAENELDRVMLSVMDLVGNKRYGVTMGAGYFSRRRWQELLEKLRVRNAESFERLALYAAPLNWVFGRSLHFMTRLERV